MTGRKLPLHKLRIDRCTVGPARPVWRAAIRFTRALCRLTLARVLLSIVSRQGRDQACQVQAWACPKGQA